MTEQNCEFEEYVNFQTEIVERQYTQLKNSSTKSMMVDYESLKMFTISQLLIAYNAHRAGERSSFPPTPGNLIEHLQGDNQMPTPDQIIAAARLKKTPLGVLAAIQIGSYDLESQDAFYLRQRAHEVLQQLGEWKNKFYSNDFLGLAKSVGFHESNAHKLKERLEEKGLINSSFDQPGLPRPLVQVAQIESRQTAQPKIPSQILDITDKKRATL